MSARRGKAVAFWAVGLGLAVLIGVGIVCKDRVLEQWYIWEFRSASEEEKWALAEKLAGLGPKARGVAEEWYVQNVTATVAAVDDDQRLVVLSVGRDQTVKPGYEFVIYQDDQYVGNVKVTKVFEDLSGAAILFTKKGSEIRKGAKAFCSRKSLVPDLR